MTPVSIRQARIRAARRMGAAEVPTREIGRILGCSQQNAMRLCRADPRTTHGLLTETAQAMGVSPQYLWALARQGERLCRQCGKAAPVFRRTCRDCLDVELAGRDSLTNAPSPEM